MECSSLEEFRLEGGDFKITDDVGTAFDKDGAIVVRDFLTSQELENLWATLTSTDNLLKHAFDVPDEEGGKCRLVLWKHPGDDFTGMLARSEKVAGSCEKLLGGEIYHYHTKIMMKEAKTGGKHSWHQDYGYWYQNGNLKPDMMTVFIALDPCNKSNGGLEVIKGSHRCDRVDHHLIHGQTVADKERVDEIKKHFCHLTVDLNPGDALFFHCNLLHSSGRNKSETRRYAFLIAFNRADNDPVYKHHCPNYTPLMRVTNCELSQCKNFTDFSGKEFMDPATDNTVRAELIRSRDP